MENLFDASASGDIKGRIERLRADSPRQWGKMTPAQAMAHCASVMEIAVGDWRPSRMLIGLIDRFCVGGPGGCTTHPHMFFGAMTPDEWALLMHKHIDHHLRQFNG